MDVSISLHLLAGFGALALGIGVLWSDPSRERNRHFAWLCGALSIWNLGRVVHAVGSAPSPESWRAGFLVGSCLSAPLALHFGMVLTGARRRTRLLLLTPAYTLAAFVWLWSQVPAGSSPVRWSLGAIIVLGGILLVALALVGRHALTRPAGPERRAFLLVFWGGVVAVVGGISDLVPRGQGGFVELGPLAILLFLLVVCAVIVRHRFLDVHVFLLRAVALVAGATVVAMVLWAVVRVSTRFHVLFLVSILVLAAAGPIGRLILGRARSLLTPTDPAARALAEISRELPTAGRVEEIWKTIERGRRVLPADVRLDVYRTGPGGKRFHLVHRSGGDQHREAPAIPADVALPQMLDRERLPLTRRYLEQERREARGARARLADQALEQFGELDLRLAVPMTSGRQLAGWIGISGGLLERHLTAEVATAFQAVGQQMAASLDRIDALETARRGEALAAVGELAAGLAHEVRNPVAAISGAVQAMGPEATDEQRDEMLGVVREESDRLARFVGEFLEYAGPTDPQRVPVDLGQAVRRSLRSMELAGNEIDSRVLVGESVPPALADPEQIRRVLDNLIRNAVEAAGDELQLMVEIQREGRREVSLRIEDNGPGIPPDRLQELFRPFRSTKPGGTGLGLALTHRIVEAHGGRVRVEGRPGVGAAFCLTLPAAEERSA